MFLFLFTARHGGVSELRRAAAMEIFSERKGREKKKKIPTNRINVFRATIFEVTLAPSRAAWQARKQEPWLLYLDSVFLHPRPLHTRPRPPPPLLLLLLLLVLDTFLLTRPPRRFLSTDSAKREVGM